MDNVLETQPIDGTAPKKFRNQFNKGDDVLIKVKHFHGYHATVLDASEPGQNVVRIVEEGHTGVLAQFSDDELVAATDEHLGQHNSTRLPYDYKD